MSGDSKKRLTFIARLIAQAQEEPRFLKYIRRTDESKFTNNDVFNKWNNRYCSDNKLFWTNAISFQHAWGNKHSMWTLMCKLLCPSFYDCTSTDMKYLDLLSNQLTTFLGDILLDIRVQLFFQQDTLAYYIIIVRQYLEKTFNRI